MLTIKAAKHTTSVKPQAFFSCDVCPTPNIYLIIADEYASRESLKDLFSFDNSLFENELKKRGFFVAGSAKSNYNFTPYSMASLFSMNYLRGITAKSNDRHNLNICFQDINNNELARILKKLNYEFVNLSLFDFAGEPNISNHNNFYSSRAELISSQTLTGRLKKDLIFHLAFTLKWGWAYRNYLDNLRDDLEYQYKTTIEQSMERGKPRFIYTHFIMPHYPYLYNEEGTPQPVEPALNGGKKEYLGFLQYGNKRLLSLIDTIQKNDRTAPTIILMSDHGFTKYDSRETDSSYNFKNIFNIYITDRNYGSFSDTISNVNVFRILLNSRFNQRLPLLKDSSFFLTEY
jgi:hypothetical protein